MKAISRVRLPFLISTLLGLSMPSALLPVVLSCGSPPPALPKKSGLTEPKKGEHTTASLPESLEGTASFVRASNDRLALLGNGWTLFLAAEGDPVVVKSTDLPTGEGELTVSAEGVTHWHFAAGVLTFFDKASDIPAPQIELPVDLQAASFLAVAPRAIALRVGTRIHAITEAGGALSSVEFDVPSSLKGEVVAAAASDDLNTLELFSATHRIAVTNLQKSAQISQADPHTHSFLSALPPEQRAFVVSGTTAEAPKEFASVSGRTLRFSAGLSWAPAALAKLEAKVSNGTPSGDPQAQAASGETQGSQESTDDSAAAGVDPTSTQTGTPGGGAEMQQVAAYEEVGFFNSTIRPLAQSACGACHGAGSIFWADATVLSSWNGDSGMSAASRLKLPLANAQTMPPAAQTAAIALLDETWMGAMTKRDLLIAWAEDRQTVANTVNAAAQASNAAASGSNPMNAQNPVVTATPTPTPIPAAPPTPTEVKFALSDNGWTTTGLGGAQATFTNNGNGTFTIKGTGSDIYGEADFGSFHHRQVTGDFTMTMKVDGVDNSDEWAKVGLMIRASLDSNARMAFHSKAPNNVVKTNLIYRNTAGQFTMNTFEDRAEMWFRLKRTGGTLTAEVSADGTNWLAYGPQLTGFQNDVYVGVAYTPKSNNLFGATVSSFELVTPPPAQ